MNDILDKIEDNDPTMTVLKIGRNVHDDHWVYTDFSTLGVAVGENTHLKELNVDVHSLSGDMSAFQMLFDGLKDNSSICKLHIKGNNRNGNTLGDMGIEILRAYQANSNQLTHLTIEYFQPLQQNGGCGVVADTLSSCTNLKTILLYRCGVTDEQLIPMIDAVRGHRQLEEWELSLNSIGNVGCDALVTLLEEPNCNIQFLDLQANDINLTHEGTIKLANGLADNTKLQTLILGDNPTDRNAELNVDPCIVEDIFTQLVCNTSSISSTFSSNHTLSELSLPLVESLTENFKDTKLTSLLKLNKGVNKGHVAIKKILKYHPIINMEPLFEFVSSEDDERNLKALPYVIAWFGKAKVAIAEEVEEYHIDNRKISAVFEFVRTMPLLFEGIKSLCCHTKSKGVEGQHI